MSCAQMNQSTISLDQMAGLWYGEQQKKGYDKKCRVPTVKHGGGSNVKVWGCFAWNDVGNLVFIEENMTGEMYKNILDENLFPSSRKLQLGSGMVFQHENNPKHTAHVL